MMDKKPMKVMLVDDDPDLREALSDILKIKGFESVPADTGAAALARIEQQDIDVALIDLKLEDISGLEVLRGIKERSPDTECILLTGYASQATAIEAINLGAYAYFQKPYDVEQLLVVIRRAAEKREAEEALKKSESRFRALIENSAEMILVINETGAIQFASPSVEPIMGYKSEDAIGRNFLEWVHPEDLPLAMEALDSRSKIPGTAPNSMIVRGRHIDGIWRFMEVLGTNLLADDAIRGIVLNVRDVTERKRAEDALRESEKKYQVLTEISPVGVFKTDTQGTTTYVNPRWCQISGLSAEEALGDGWLRAVPLEDREKISANWKKAADARVASMAEYRFVRPDGSIAWVLGQATPERNTENQIIGYVGTITDITELKIVQKELADSEVELRALFAAMTDVVIVYDADGRYIKIAPTSLINFYRPLDDMLGKAVHDILPKEQADYIVAKISEAIQTSHVVIGEYALQIDGKEIWFASSASRLSENTVIWVAHDITERKHAEEALQNNEKRLRALIEHGRDNISLLAADGTLLWESPSTNSTLGYAPSQFVGRNMFELVHPDDQGWTWELYAQILQTPGKSQAGIFRLRHANGTWRWIESTTANMLHEPSVQAIVINYRDITERKRAEANLVASEAELRALFASMQDVVLVIDREGVYRKIAPTNPGLLVSPPEELLGKNLRDIFPVGQAEAFLEAVRQTLETRQTTQIEYELIIEGRLVWFSTFISPMDKDSTLWVERNITERKQAEEGLRRFAQRQETLVAMGRSLAATLELKEIYRAAHLHLQTLTDCPNFAISLFDDAAQTLRASFICASGEELDPALLPTLKLDPQNTSGGRALAIFSQEPVIASDLAAASQAPGTIIIGDERLPDSAIYLPMLVEGKVIGLLELQSYQPHAYSKTDGNWISMVANQLGLAIQNARLFEQTRQRVAELEMLYQSELALSQLLSPKEIGQKIIELLGQNMDWHHTTIRYHHKDETLELLAFNQPGLKNEKEWREAKERFSNIISKPGDGLSVWAVQNSQIVRSGDVGNDPRYVETYPGLHSGLYVPMKSGQRVIGVISIESEEPNAFSEANERIVATLANQAASALENARLFEETRRRVTELETLNRISITLRVASGQDKMLAVVLEETLNALNTQNGSISLWSPGTSDLHQVIARGWLADLTERPVKPGEGVFGTVFASGQIHLSREFASDPLTLPEEHDQIPPGWGGACVPIHSADQILGILVLAVPSTRELSRDEILLLNTLAEMTGTALHRASLHEETVHRLSRLESLRVVDRAVAGSLDKRVTLNILLNQVISQLEVDAADVLLLNAPLQTLQFTAGQGFHTGLHKSASVRVGESFAGRAVLERRMVRVTDRETARENQDFFAFWVNEEFADYYAVPLIAKGQVKGVIEVFRRKPFTPDSEWLNFLETLAHQAAIALDNAQLFENLQSANMDLTLAYDATIEGWSRAMDLRDEETEGHTRRVTEMAVSLAQAFGLNDKEIIHLRRGALLHDIGKMGVPDHILLKSGKLTDEEWEIMSKHPQLAYEMLSSIAYLRPSIEIPYLHHEKWDGTGYPQGLKGEQTPLAARIFAIVDVYDALTSDRPYRKAWTKADALNYICEQSGKHFDPRVVEKFMDLWEQKG
jgi:PAS domain S-box-containing protein